MVLSADAQPCLADAGEFRDDLVAGLGDLETGPGPGGDHVARVQSLAAPGRVLHQPGQQAERVAERMRALRLRGARADAELALLLREIDLRPVLGAAPGNQRA